MSFLLLCSISNQKQAGINLTSSLFPSNFKDLWDCTAQNSSLFCLVNVCLAILLYALPCLVHPSYCASSLKSFVHISPAWKLVALLLSHLTSLCNRYLSSSLWSVWLILVPSANVLTMSCNFKPNPLKYPTRSKGPMTVLQSPQYKPLYQTLVDYYPLLWQ